MKVIKRKVRMSNDNYEKGLMMGVVFGGLIGAGLAFFLTPKNGEENRAMAREKALQLKEAAGEKMVELKKHMMTARENLTDTVLGIFGEVSEVTLSLYEDAQNLLAKQLKALKENVDDIDKEKYAKVVEHIGEILERNKKYNAKQIGKVKRYLLERFD